MEKIKEIKIEIELSPELDVQGFNILKKEIHEDHPLYPQFKKRMDEFGEENLEEKIQEFLDREDTKKILGSIAKRWQEVRGDFLELVLELFDNKVSHHVDHIQAYPTIWDVVIQIPEKKAVSFSIDENIDKSIYEIIHEVMHILFLTYLMDNHQSYFAELGGINGLWEAQEVFNGVVLNTEKFKKLYPDFTPTNYSSIEDRVNEISEKLGNDFTVSEFLNIYRK